MAITFNAAGTPVSGSAVSTITVNRPGGILTGDLIVIALGFEGVGAASGPWVIPNTGQFANDVAGPFTGWKQVAMQSPSASGNGLEVWAACQGAGATHAIFNLNASYNVVAVEACWTGEYAPTGSITDGAIRASTQQQVSGNNPTAPSIYTYTNELVIACGADQLTAGYGTPTLTGWTFTSRTDSARGGMAGNVECVLADAITPFEGNSGAIMFTATAASGGIGATATLAVRPATSPPASTNPALAMLFPSA